MFYLVIVITLTAKLISLIAPRTSNHQIIEYGTDK